MARSLIILIIVFSFFSECFAQDWSNNLQQSSGGKELTLHDYQKAFSTYWKPYNVKGGYYFDSAGVKQKAAGWKQFKRWEYYQEARTNPTTGAFSKVSAIEQHKKWLKANPQASQRNSSGNWSSMGPSSSGGGYAGTGRINCVSFHPSDNNTYWIGSPAGGLWKTTNNGDTWVVLTDNNSVLGVSDIAISSNYTIDRTIYIATGDKDGGSIWSLGGGQSNDNNSIGILKSTDDGITWNTTGLSYAVSQKTLISRLIIDPSNNDILYAATNRGIFKSINAGTNWTNVYNPGGLIMDLEFKPGNSSTLYASTERNNTTNCIYRSTDSGENWSTQATKTGCDRIDISVTPANSDYLYAIVANSGGGLHSILQSTDSGESFTARAVGSSTFNLLSYYSDGSGGSGGQGGFDLAIATSPTDKNMLFVGGANTHKSTDGGLTWACVNMWTSHGYYNFGGHPEVHADKHMLKFRSNGDLFETNDGGVYISTNEGTTWTDKTSGIINSQMYRLGVSQTSSTEVITGLQDNGSKLVVEGRWSDVKLGDGMECIIDYTDETVQYATYVNGQISRTTDHWNTAIAIEPAGAGSGFWVTPYIIDPNASETIYAGYADLYKSTDKGDNWEKISTINTSSKLRAIAIAPSNSNYLYVSDPNQLWVTNDGGVSWTEKTAGLPVALGSITNIAVKSSDPNTAWVTFGGYSGNSVYQTSDAGNTWINISSGLPNLPVMSVVQNSQNLNRTEIYVGTDVGIYLKLDDEDWVSYSTNLPNVVVNELDIYYDAIPTKSRLRAATSGRGLWESSLFEEPTGKPELTTTSPSSITKFSAITGGNISDQGDAPVTERGTVWSASSHPTISDTKIIDEQVGTGNFESEIIGLYPATIYHTRAYAINSSGITYGQDEQFTTLCSKITTFPFVEDFESGELPNCWTYEGTNWAYEIWGYSNNLIPHGGDYNALFYHPSTVANVSKLITPSLDLSTFESASLTFWRAQESFNNNQDELRVYYRTSKTGIWIEIIAYTNESPVWQEEVINLPEISSDYYIAFEATSKFGYGVAIDDVEISTFCTPPNPATAFVTDVEDEHDVTISWLRGSGSSTLVLAKEGSPVDAFPRNGLVYTANSTFGVGDEIGSGNFVVANGDINSVSITNLNTASEYHFSIIEYSNSPGHCYCPINLLGIATTTGYCNAGASNSSEIINDVSFGAINNTESGLGTGGYQDWTMVFTEVETGGSYPVNIALKLASPQDKCRVWIDWNKNENFEDDGELVFESETGVGPYSGNIVVPTTATLGQTLMRIRVWNTQDELNESPCGQANSGEIEDYTINVLPCSLTIENNLSNKTVCSTDNATFSLTASGTAPFSYQWLKDGTEIPNTNSSSYTVTDLATSNGSGYSCFLRNICGSIYSDIAILSIDEQVVANAGEDVEVCNDVITLGGNAPTPGTGIWVGGGTVANENNANTAVSDLSLGANIYTWLITNGVCMSSDDVVITNNSVTADAGAEQNVCSTNAFLAGTNPNTGSGYWSTQGSALIASPTQMNSEVSNMDLGLNIFTWEVTNGTCIATDNTSITVGNQTVISTQPININTITGNDVTFSLVASGDNLLYQWRFEGVDLNLETANTLNLFDVTQADAGNYDAIITGDCGSITTDIAVLSVTTSLEKLAQVGIHIFPNPSNGHFNISVENNLKTVNIEIIDIEGKVIYEKELTENLFSADLSKAAGIYFIKFNIDGEIIISQIVVR